MVMTVSTKRLEAGMGQVREGKRDGIDEEHVLITIKFVIADSKV
jgi:hypothetical protein